MSRHYSDFIAWNGKDNMGTVFYENGDIVFAYNKEITSDYKNYYIPTHILTQLLKIEIKDKDTIRFSLDGIYLLNFENQTKTLLNPSTINDLEEYMRMCIKTLKN